MIKQPWLLAVSALCLLVAIGLATERLMFLAGSAETVGKVIRLEHRNERCGSQKRRYACTKFTAEVQYKPQAGGTFEIEISAGSSRGSDAPLTSANLRVDDPVPVVYSPGNPSKAYQNTFFGVWGAPLVAAGAQIATLFGSMAEGRRRRW